MSSFKNLPAAAEPSKPSLVSIERVVAAFTPAFAAVAGWVTTIVGKNVPGVTIPKGDVIDLFIGGAASAVLAAITWLVGRQKWTAITHTAHRDLADVEGVVRKVVAEQPQLGAALGNIEGYLRSHESNIIKAIEDKVGASATAEQVVSNLLDAAQKGRAVPAPVAGQGAATTQ